MWVLSGPFDGDEGVVDFEKSKLLKPAKEYILGRKEVALVVNSKKVSRSHAIFKLGSYSTRDVADTSSRPAIRLHNPRDRPMGFGRKSDKLQIGPSSTVELHDGDVLFPYGSLSLRLNWQRVCCYMPNPLGRTLEDCASLGINLVRTFHTDITHYVTSTRSLTPSLVLSLASGIPLVMPEWLAEVARLGRSDTSVAPLELDFKLPPISNFRPQFAPSLPLSLQSDRLWEQNSDRLLVFSGYSFIFLISKGDKETSFFPELISLMGGRSTLCPADSDVLTLRRIFSKKRAGKTLIVGDESIKDTIGDEQWNVLVEEVKNFVERIIPGSLVLEAAITMDLLVLNEGISKNQDKSTTSSVLPDLVTASGSSDPPLLSERLHSSVQPALAPDDGVKDTSIPGAAPTPTDERPRSPSLPPRRPLMRRAGTAMRTFAPSDNSSILDDTLSVPVAEESTSLSNKPVLGVDFDAPVVPRSSRLKRRAGTAGVNAPAENTHEVISVEPPLKKFKSLFDESDPDRLTQTMGGTLIGASVPPSSDEVRTLLSDETQLPKRMPSPPLSYSAEEVEGGAMSNQAESQVRGLKRKSDRLEDDHDNSQTGGRATKRQALGSLAGDDVHPRGPASSQQPPVVHVPQRQSQTASVTPDVDHQFLKAISSMRKGKKNEDTFDREFNGLRISKPDLQREDREQEWSVLDDFEDERNIRGNFMVVVEMEVTRKDHEVASRGTGRADWEGRLDFKKFRKKHLSQERPVVELAVSDGNDYGLGSGYWKENSQNKSQPSGGSLQREHASFASQPLENKALAVPAVDSEDSEEDGPLRPTKKVMAFRTRKDVQVKKINARTTGEKDTAGRLFLESDDDLMEVDELDELDETMTLRSTRSSQPPKSQATRQRKKITTAVVIDDDSDDGAAFKGFGARSKIHSRR